MSPRPTRMQWIDAILSEHGPRGAQGGREAVGAPVVRLTLVALARHLDRSSRCWPGIPRLAAQTSLGERTVRRALQQAVDEGWVIRTPRGRGYVYEACIPAGAAAVSDDEMRPERPVSAHVENSATPVGAAAITTPAGAATVAGAAGEHRPERPPKPVIEARGESIPPSTSSVFTTLTPSGESAREGGKVGFEKVNIAGLRAALIQHALLGQEEAVTRHGERIGIGLLLTQARRLIASGVDPELLATMVKLVRSDEEAPSPDDPYSLQWFEKPARWSRVEGLAHKRLADGGAAA